jgi:hypothetical protein
MADEPRIPPAGLEGHPPPPAQPQQVQIPVDVSTLATGYINWFRFTGSAEELIIDLGLTPQLGQLLAPQPNQPAPEPIKLTHRLVMNFYTAKRLLQTLQRAIAMYESHYGPVEVDPMRRSRTPPPPPPPPGAIRPGGGGLGP